MMSVLLLQLGLVLEFPHTTRACVMCTKWSVSTGNYAGGLEAATHEEQNSAFAPLM